MRPLDNPELWNVEMLLCPDRSIRHKDVPRKEARRLLSGALKADDPVAWVLNETAEWDLFSLPPKKNADEDEKDEDTDERFGHGDHWDAVEPDFPPNIGRIIEQILTQGRVIAAYPPFDPDPGYSRLLHYELQLGEMTYTLVEGMHADEDSAGQEVLTMYPAFPQGSVWPCRFDGIDDAYGPYERVVEVMTASGHWLECFCPRFGLRKKPPETGSVYDMTVSALLLRVEPYDSRPFCVTEGPMVDELREELIAEGNLKEANDPNLFVEIDPSEMRYLIPSTCDHADLVGKVLEMEAIKTAKGLRGWRMLVECLPENPFGRDLTVYVFDIALKDGYAPRKGCLIQAKVWLQASIDRKKPKRESSRWQIEWSKSPAWDPEPTPCEPTPSCHEKNPDDLS